MDAKHTPTPWRLTNDEIVSDCSRERFVAVCEFIDLIRGDDDTTENLANAAFIVRAANNHEALVAFAQKVINVSASGKDTVSLLVSLHDLAVEALKVVSAVEAA